LNQGWLVVTIPGATSRHSKIWILNMSPKLKPIIALQFGMHEIISQLKELFTSLVHVYIFLLNIN